MVAPAPAPVPAPAPAPAPVGGAAAPKSLGSRSWSKIKNTGSGIIGFFKNTSAGERGMMVLAVIILALAAITFAALVFTLGPGAIPMLLASVALPAAALLGIPMFGFAACRMHRKFNENGTYDKLKELRAKKEEEQRLRVATRNAQRRVSRAGRVDGGSPAPASVPVST